MKQYRHKNFFAFGYPMRNQATEDEFGYPMRNQAVRHVTGNDKDYLRKIPRVVW